MGMFKVIYDLSDYRSLMYSRYGYNNKVLDSFNHLLGTLVEQICYDLYTTHVWFCENKLSSNGDELLSNICLEHYIDTTKEDMVADISTGDIKISDEDEDIFVRAFLNNMCREEMLEVMYSVGSRIANGMSTVTTLHPYLDTSDVSKTLYNNVLSIEVNI